MSHLTTIDLAVTDLDALAAACPALGLELVRDVKTYKWYGRSVGDYPLPAGFEKADLGKCDHVIRIAPGKGSSEAYEIGVCRRKDGKPGYQLLWDFWRGGYGLEAAVGSNASKLVQEYTATVAKKKYSTMGFRLSNASVVDGKLRLQFVK